MSLPLAAFSASTALLMACCAEPLASEPPAWALLSTASMRTSLCWTRAWVFSTSEDTASTFVLISPTSRCTNDFFAQPERATLAASTGTTSSLTMTSLARVRGRVSARVDDHSSGRRHVAAASADHFPFAGGAHLGPAKAGRSRGGIISQSVLVLELDRDPFRSALQAGEVADLIGGPAGEGRVARQDRAPLRGRPEPLLPHEEGGSAIVQGRDHGHGVDGHVEGARAGDHRFGLLLARGVDAVGDDHHRAPAFAVARHVAGRLVEGVVESGRPEGRDLVEAPLHLRLVPGEGHDPPVAPVEARERRLV